MFQKLFQSDASKTTSIIRLLVGVVFLSEGIQKWLYPALRGSGRFERIGFPSPEFLGHFVGSLEIICGMFILLGFLTRAASSITFLIMLVALSTTKFTMLMNEGFWEMMHASRTDFAMLLGSLFLIIKGGGYYSFDAFLIKNRDESE